MSHPNSVHKRETESVTVVPGANGRNAARAAELAADEAIVERIASGDTAGLGDLYNRHSRIVYSLACRLMSDGTEAEDVVQDVFSQAWRQASRYDSARAAVTGWLLMMTRRER